MWGGTLGVSNDKLKFLSAVTDHTALISFMTAHCIAHCTLGILLMIGLLKVQHVEIYQLNLSKSTQS